MVYARDVKRTARGPHAAREGIECGPRENFSLCNACGPRTDLMRPRDDFAKHKNMKLLSCLRVCSVCCCVH